MHHKKEKSINFQALIRGMFDTRSSGSGSGKELEAKVSDVGSGIEAEAKADSCKDERPKSPLQMKAYAKRIVQALREKGQAGNPYPNQVYGGGQNKDYSNQGNYGSERTGHYRGKTPQAPGKGKSGKPSE